MEDFAGPNLNCIISHWDLTTLPGTPVVNIENPTPLLPMVFSSSNDFDFIAVDNYIIYVYEFYPDLYLRRFNVTSGNWDTSETVLYAVSLTDLQNPRLAVDSDNYIYLSYDSHTSVPEQWHLMVRRSSAPGIVDDFQIEVIPRSSGSGEFNADLAVAGNSGSEYCALVFWDPNASSDEIVCDTSIAQDWTIEFWGGLPYTVASQGSGLFVLGPSAAFDADGETLYVTWADNSLGNDEVWGAISRDGGLTFDNREQLTDNAMSLIDGPVIATGTDPGVYAIAYTRNTGGLNSPFVLCSVPAFFDQCNGPPSNYWDIYDGVTQSTNQYFSEPYSYQMATAATRGQLISEYGSVEHTGGVNLMFYDDTTITTEDFYVALENNNARGVIRMLGVRNDTTNTNYAYSLNGEDWVDLMVPRATGWHNLVITANETDGLSMYIDDITHVQTDPAFQTFTRVVIDGGTSSDPYYVDDISVHAVPLIEFRPIPATSPLFLVLLLAGVGVILVRRK
jgi:hypothetical protein